MKFILANAYREWRIRVSNPIIPLWDVLVPVVYLVLFGSSMESWVNAGASGIAYPTFFLGGVLGMVTFSIAMNSSYGFFEDLQSGVFHEILTYPFSRSAFLLGKLLSNAVFSVVAVSVCLVAGAVFLKIPVKAEALPGLLAWTVLGTAGWYFVYSWLSLKVRSFNGYHTSTSTLYLLLMFVSNLFYPTDQLPAWASWAAWLNPITWQVDLMRYHIYGAGPPAQLRWEAAAFVGFVGASFWVANRKLNGTIE
ncbi:MAG: ABC transporter permease [Terriglobales bacterium]